MRIIVCGSRQLADQQLVDDELGDLVEDIGSLVVMHGGCETGADALADDWCERQRRLGWVIVERYPADWKTHGKAAGPIRNTQMALRGADLCIAFWNGSSRGTLDMITKATKRRIRTRVVPWSVL